MRVNFQIILKLPCLIIRQLHHKHFSLCTLRFPVTSVSESRCVPCTDRQQAVEQVLAEIPPVELVAGLVQMCKFVCNYLILLSELRISSSSIYSPMVTSGYLYLQSTTIASQALVRGSMSASFCSARDFKPL